MCAYELVLVRLNCEEGKKQKEKKKRKEKKGDKKVICMSFNESPFLFLSVCLP